MRTTWLILPSVLAASTAGYATTYLSVEQAQEALFSGARFAATPLTLTPDQCKAIEKASGVKVRFPELKLWRVNEHDGWFVVDDVLGKYEFITYAVGLDADGKVKGVEILAYRENHGAEVHEAKWLAQFSGK